MHPSPLNLAPLAAAPIPRRLRIHRSSFIIHRSSFRVRHSAFTLIELMVVIGIIAIVFTIALPAVKSLTKGNDQTQAVNLVRAMISTARSIASSQHRMAGVVFFEENGKDPSGQPYSRPANPNQTAMQIFVEDYNQQQWGMSAGNVMFIYQSTTRQYLPQGIKVATLTDNGLASGENANTNQQARAILFDGNGELITRSGLSAPFILPDASHPSGTYAPTSGGGLPYGPAYGDWKFFYALNITNASSSPGFFLYNKAEYDAQTFTTDALRATWLTQHADVIIINPNTGNVIR